VGFTDFTEGRKASEELTEKFWTEKWGGQEYQTESWRDRIMGR
jgi:hypothetical protein